MPVRHINHLSHLSTPLICTQFLSINRRLCRQNDSNIITLLLLQIIPQRIQPFHQLSPLSRHNFLTIELYVENGAWRTGGEDFLEEVVAGG